MSETTTVPPTITPEYLAAQGLSRSAKERWESKVDKSGGPDACWPWTGSRTIFGHGQMSRGGKCTKPMRAHQVTWILHYGPLPKGLWILHKCPGKHNKLCQNPKHLAAGTHKENMQDMADQGTSAFKRIPRKQRMLVSNKTNFETAQYMRELNAQGWSQNELARRFGMVQGSVWNILHYVTYKPEDWLDNNQPS